MNTADCAKARETIQSCLDRHRKLEPVVTAHLAVCPACRRFQEFIAALGGRLKSELNVPVPISMPDSSYLVRQSRLRRKHRRIVYSLSGPAAALVISLGAVREARIQEQVSEEALYFIDALFNRPLFKRIEFFSISQ